MPGPGHQSFRTKKGLSTASNQNFLLQYSAQFSNLWNMNLDAAELPANNDTGQLNVNNLKYGFGYKEIRYDLQGR